jgi:hypothetical protein
MSKETLSEDQRPYRVEQDPGAIPCECGRNVLWTVVYVPEDVAISTSWEGPEGREMAEDIRDLMNTAHDRARALAIEAAPLLRRLAKQCEGCGGAGENVYGTSPEDERAEECTHCKPIWNLIERIEPPHPARTPAPAQPAQEENDEPF